MLLNHSSVSMSHITHLVCAHQLLADALEVHPGPWDARDKALAEVLHLLLMTCSLFKTPPRAAAYVRSGIEIDRDPLRHHGRL